MIAYLFLGVAIVIEVLGSTLLKLSNGFSRVGPSVGVVLSYGLAFYTLSLALKELPLGLAYATWSGVGTILTVLAGMYLFKEKINKQAVAGIALLVIGIALLNLSKS